MSNKRILIIDDDLLTRLTLSQYLTKCGYETAMAADGVEGLALARSEQFHLVLVDLRMPRVDGLEVIANLHTEQPDLPLVIVSETRALGDVIEAMRLGAWDYIAKPIQDMKEITIVVERALDKARLLAHREQVEEALKESEARFRDVALSMSDWVWEVDSQGRYTYCSGRVVDVLGYSVEEVLGKTPFDLMPPDEATRVGRIFEKIVGNREPIVDLENWNIDREGHQICLLTNGAPMFDREGNFIGYRGVDKDITERKRTEMQIGLLNRLKEDLLSPSSLDEKLKRITDGVVEIFGADFCRIWITKPGDLCDSDCIHAEVTEGPLFCRHRDRCLHLAVSSGRYTHTDGEVHRRIPFGCETIGRVAAGEYPKFVITDVTHDPRVHDHDWAEELGLVSSAGYRLLLETGEPLGVLALFSKQVISPGVDALLEGLANTTAQVIQTARAEEALRASEKRLRAIVEGIQAFMVNVDIYGHFTFVNEAVARIVGYDSPEELVGKQYLSFVHPQDRDRVRDSYLSQVSTGRESALTEFRIVAAEGKARWFSFLSTLIVQDGQIVGQAGIGQDITDRKQAELELLEAERRFRTLLDNVRLVAVGLDQDGNVAYANPHFLALTGYTLDEALGKNWFQTFVPKRERPVVGAVFSEIMETGIHPYYENHILIKEGEERLIAWNNTLLLDPDGKPVGTMGIGEDITERKRTEGALRESHERFLTVLDGIDAHIYAADMETYEILFVNRRMRDDFGDGLVGKTCWQEFRGDSGPCAHCTNDKLLDADGNPTGVFVWEGNNPITDKWYENYDRAVEWVDGRLVRLQIAIDITVRKQGEARLAAVHALGQRLVLSRDTAEIAQLVVDAAQQVLRFPMCSLWLVDEEQQVMVLWAHLADQETPEVPPLTLDGERSIIVAAIRSGEPIYLPDVSQDPRYVDGGSMFRSELCIPLKVGDRVFGVLNAEGDQLDAFSPADVQLLEALASTAAIGLENARLHKETQQLATFNESIVQSMAEGILVADTEGRLTFVNSTVATLLGNSSEELMGQHWTTIVPPDQHHIVQAADERRARGEADHYELEMMRKDGTRLFTLLSSGPRFEEGRFAGTLAVFTDITERKRVEKETQRRATQAALIYKVGQRVSGELELDTLLSEIVVAIRDAFDYDNVMMMLLDEDGERLTLQSIVGGYADAFADDLWLAIGEGMIGHAAATGETQASGDVSQNPHYVRKEQETTQSELAVPIKSGEKVIGVLDLQSEEFNAFDESDVVAMETLSTQIATAINNARLFEETQRRMTQLTLISDVGEKIAAVLDMESLLERAVCLVQESFGYHHVAIFTVDREQDELIMRARAGDFSHLYPLDHRLSLGQGMVGWVGRHNETLLANDVDAEPRYVNLYPDKVPTRSELCVPIGVGREVMGVLDVQSLQLDAFDKDDVMVIETVARQVAAAMENALLHGEILGHTKQLEQRVQERTNDLERRSVQLRVAAEIARDATSARELNDLLNSAVNLVRDRFGFYHAGIFLLDKRSEYAILKAATGEAGRQMIERKHKLKVGETGIVGYATGTGQPRIALDVGADAVHFKNPLLPETRSEMALPFKVNDQVIGALDVQSTQEAAFDEEDVAILQTMADQLAVAITRLERAAELEVQHARLDATLRSTADGIVVADEEGNIIQANPVAQAWLTQTLAPEEAERLQEAIRSAVAQTKERTVELLELTGLDLEVKAAPIAGPGLDEAAAVVAIHDVSHLKSLDRMKTRFITNISHELRTPITTIKLYAYLMRQRPEKWEQYLNVLAQEADRLARLVEDILEISHVDSGRLEMKLYPTSLDELTGSVVASHQALAQEQGLSLEHLPAEAETVALADPDRITQALNNLVGNAIRYTSEGGRVTISTGEQEAEGRIWAIVTVADTGMGIPEQDLPHIFDRFFRGEEPRAMQLTGTGLGLSIAEEIVELHGGRVTVESEVGAGSTFTVWLPLAD